MADLKFENLKTITTNGLSQDEARERINSIVLDDFAKGRNIQQVDGGSTCLATETIFGASMLYYFISSSGNKHDVVVAFKYKTYIWLLTIIGAILLTLFNILFLHLNGSDSLKLGIVGAIVVIIILEIAAHKAKKKAGLDFAELEQLLSKAERDGVFNS